MLAYNAATLAVQTGYVAYSAGNTNNGTRPKGFANRNDLTKKKAAATNIGGKTDSETLATSANPSL